MSDEDQKTQNSDTRPADPRRWGLLGAGSGRGIIHDGFYLLKDERVSVVEHSALVKAAERIAELEAELSTIKSKEDIEVSPGVFQVIDPEKISAFMKKRIDALAGEGVELMRERAKLLALVDVIGKALDDIHGMDFSRLNPDAALVAEETLEEMSRVMKEIRGKK